MYRDRTDNFFPEDLYEPLWVEPFFLKKYYNSQHQSARFAFGVQKAPPEYPQPHLVERRLIKKLKQHVEKACKILCLKADESLLSLSLSPNGTDLYETVDEVKRLRKKVIGKKDLIIAYRAIPEPRPLGTAHINLILRVKTKNVMIIRSNIDKKLQDEGEVHEFWKNKETGEFTYTYSDQCRDIARNSIPGPIWYAYKTMITEIGLQSHDIITEVSKRPERVEYASAIEAAAWRGHAGLHPSGGQRKEIKSRKKQPVTLNYNKGEISPILKHRGFLNPILAKAMRENILQRSKLQHRSTKTFIS